MHIPETLSERRYLRWHCPIAEQDGGRNDVTKSEIDVSQLCWAQTSNLVDSDLYRICYSCSCNTYLPIGNMYKNSCYSREGETIAALHI